MRRPVMSGAVFVLLTAAAAPVASAEEPEGGCWTRSVPVPEETDASEWLYEHTVEWCGDGKSVTYVRAEGEFTEEHTEDCVPAGKPVVTTTPGTPGWDTFSMGTLECEPEVGQPLQVCPWVILTVNGDGTYAVDTGIQQKAVVPAR
jgi:hypothetical protein